MSKGKVIVGYIHGGMVHSRFMRSLINVMSYDAERDKIIKNLYESESTDIVQNRNFVAKGFLEQDEAEWLWFVDTDIIMMPDTLYRLYEFADRDARPIVTGMYFSYLSREVNYPLPLMFHRTAEGEYRSLDRSSDQPIKIDGCGMGCCLIHRSVLEAIEAKYRDIDPWVWFGRDVVEMKGRKTRLGEDFTFCRRAQELGFTIWGHCGVQVDHIKSRVESFATFLQGNKLYELEHGVDASEDIIAGNPSEGPSERKKIRQDQAEPGRQIRRNGLSLPEGPDSRQTDEPAQAQQVNGA